LIFNASRKDVFITQFFPSVTTAADGSRFGIFLPFYGNWLSSFSQRYGNNGKSDGGNGSSS
jgi:hypothetical protein